MKRRWPAFGALLWFAGQALAADARADPLVMDASATAGHEADLAEPVEDEPAPESDEHAPAELAETQPWIVVEGSVSLGYEMTSPHDHPASRIHDAFAAIDPEIAIHLAPRIRIGAVLGFEPVIDPEPGEDRFFEDHGLFVEELYAGFDIGRATFQGGKIAPTFGWAADDAPGLYGDAIAGEYELIEKIGLQGRLVLSESEGPVGGVKTEQMLHAALFTADRTFLGDALFTGRDRLRLAHGGVGNTTAPESFAFAYTYQTRDSDDELVGPAFQLAVRRLAPGVDDDHAEWGFVGAVESRFLLADGYRLSPLAEAAYFLHADGGREPGWAVTVGAELAKGAWRASSTVGTGDMRADDEQQDYAITIDLGRFFEVPGLGDLRADVAYAFGRDEGERTHVIGLQIEKELDFGWPR
jgi:hypothetical protein